MSVSFLVTFFSPLHKLLAWLVVGGCFAFTTGLLAPTAHADPHAMYYTVIGQQQLFFNVLAALDQADYVEPQLGTNSRTEKLDARNDLEELGAPIQEALDPILQATKTDLSAVLTRGITLEGQDLWSTYIAYQAARDRRGTLGANEDIRNLCDVTTGRVGCEEDQPPQPDRAYVYDGNDFGKEQVIDGAMAALHSNITPGSADQLLRQLKSNPAPDEIATARAWSGPIALLRKEAEESGNAAHVESLINVVVPSVYSTSVDPSVFNDLTTNKDGETKLSLNIAGRRYGNSALAQDSSEVSGPAYAQAYISKLRSISMLPAALLEETIMAKGFIKNIQEAKSEDGGAKAVTTTRATTSGTTPAAGNALGTSTANAQSKQSSIIREVNEIIQAPPHLTRAAGQVAIQAIVDGDANPLHANVGEQTGPSDAALKFDTAGQQPGTPAAQGQALGISTIASPEPRVLHAVSPLGDTDAPENKPAFQNVQQGPGTEEKPFNAFPAPAHLIKIMQGKPFGCGCHIDYSVAAYYDEIKRKLI